MHFHAAILNTSDGGKKNLISCVVLLIAGRCGAEVNESLAIMMRGWPPGPPPPFLAPLLECSQWRPIMAARWGSVILSEGSNPAATSVFRPFPLWIFSHLSLGLWPAAEQRIFSPADTRSTRSRSSVSQHQLQFLLLDMSDPSLGNVSLSQPDCGAGLSNLTACRSAQRPNTAVITVSESERHRSPLCKIT